MNKRALGVMCLACCFAELQLFAQPCRQFMNSWLHHIGWNNIQQQEEPAEKTKLVQSLNDDAHFYGMNCMDFSPDGLFLYASAWRSDSISVFEVEGMSGALRHVETFTDEKMDGNSSVRVSPDGRWAAVAVGIGKCILLLERDSESGRLTLVDQFQATFETTGDRMFNDAVFSPNSRFLAVGGMLSGDDTGSLSIFRINENDKKLEWLQTEAGPDNEILDVRSLDFSDDGKTLVVAARRGNSLVILDFDSDTGRVDVRQVLRNNDEIQCIDNIFGARISPDSQFVYTTAGRLVQTFGIGVFRFNDKGQLELVQQFTGEEQELAGALGGNEIEISHDGKYMATTLTDSREVAVFARSADDGTLTLWKRIKDPDDANFTPAGLAIGRDYHTRVVFSSEDSKRLLIHEILDK